MSHDTSGIAFGANDAQRPPLAVYAIAIPNAVTLIWVRAKVRLRPHRVAKTTFVET